MIKKTYFGGSSGSLYSARLQLHPRAFSYIAPAWLACSNIAATSNTHPSPYLLITQQRELPTQNDDKDHRGRREEQYLR